MSNPDILDEIIELTSEDRLAALLEEVAFLRAENEKLRLLTAVPIIPSAKLKVHYLYAAPLVLVDNLGSTVLETLDPIRADREFRAVPALASISIANTSSLLRLKYALEEQRISILHISMHTVDLANSSGGRSIRCALEDETGRGYLMTPDEFASSLGTMDTIKLVFVNACKSREIARAILRTCPSITIAICLGDQEPVLESVSQLFSSEFYAALNSRAHAFEAFERARLAIKANPSTKISSQAGLLELISSDLSRADLTFDQDTSSTKSVSWSQFWVGHVTPDLAISPEDFVGREVDIVRLCGVVFSSAGRRVFSITGEDGIGKSTFLAEASKYMASPGGRNLSGGVCLVRLPTVADIASTSLEDVFLTTIIEGLRDTITSLRSWYGATDHRISSHLAEEDENEDHNNSSPQGGGRNRLDSSMSDQQQQHPDLPPELQSSSSLKSYKVFWADTFQSQQELASFLDSYRLVLSEESLIRLFTELRLNGTQLQDWGSGRLIRVVHVVRLLIRGENGKYLLENRDKQLRMLSKKFDPVTENVLEVANSAIKKELGTEIEGNLLSVSRLVLRDRRPMIEVNKTSPSYPGLATKYVLYTADVSMSNLPTDRTRFVTVESGQQKIHAWEWTSGDSSDLSSLLPATDALLLRKSSKGALEMQVSNNVITVVEKAHHNEFLKLMREWAALCDKHHRHRHPGPVSSALVLLDAHAYLENSEVRQLLGKALVRHSGLKVMFSQTCLDKKPILNLTTSAVSYKVIHFPLSPLQSIDSAVLFTRRIHRPLFVRDWWIDIDAAPPPITSMGSREGLSLPDDTTEDAPLMMNAKSSRGLANLARLARHPLLIAAKGVPTRILLIAQHVTVELPSINDLVERFEDF